MDAVIFPTIMETCLGCFYLRGRTFILYQIQRDDFPFVDEGWFYYFLEYGEGLSVESIHNRRHHLLFLSQQLSYGHVSYFLCVRIEN